MNLLQLIKENKVFAICMLFALLFIYGKYFVDKTEIAKLESSVLTLGFVVLGFLFVISKQISDLQNKIEGR